MAKTLLPRQDYRAFAAHSFDWIVGLDEAGAGCLAGPLGVGAFVLPRTEHFEKRRKLAERVVDSKTLLEIQREKSFEFLQTLSDCAMHFREVPVAVIEEKNIYWARMETFLALVLEIDHQLGSKAIFIVDGPRLHIPTHKLHDQGFRECWERIEARVFAFPKADGHYFTVAAASLVAKVTRDRLMIALSAEHPQYNWARNKGYATPDHWEKITEHGLSAHHRRSFCGRLLNALEPDPQEALDL